jgi:hypothetical protein
MERFDLNIESILENWDTHDAIREIIANALDEQLLTGSKEVQIVNEKGQWIIRDYGRGIKYTDFTQNENPEKLLHPSTIGKFGIGLKDALATFDRKNIEILIRSKYSDISISKHHKHGFPEIKTLHACINKPSSENLIGTEFILKGVLDSDIQNAKNLFLIFSGEQIIESTPFGDIVVNKNHNGKIYISGVKAAEEPGFLFSYNITKKTTALQKALNRERTNVGRSAYSEVVKKILLASKSTIVAEMLAKDFQNIKFGTSHYEMLNWKDVKLHAIKILNQTGNYVFFTQEEIDECPNLNDLAKNSGKSVIIIDESVGLSLRGLKDFAGNPIINMSQFADDYEDSFEFDFVDINKLNAKEKVIHAYTKDIIKLYGGLPKIVKEIKIASKLREDFLSNSETEGCWDPKTNSIVIHRKKLKSLSEYSGVLIHEIIHAKTNYEDITREFENKLTDAIGIMCEAALKKTK